ncbi:MAG: ABC transporter ATP-binding protein [Terricaulis sp.]
MSEACSVSLSGVRRVYDGARALDDVTLTAPKGQVLALLGASGSGKSTILRLIAGLEPVDAGEIRFGDELVSAPGRTTPTETRRVGMVFQDYSLFPHLNAAANVAFGLERSARGEAIGWLERVGLGNRANAFPHELSGGEQQRVALARALAPRPRAILLDEPFSGLDPVLRAELRETTLDAIRAAGATAVFVTHDAEEALLVADRLAILKKGKLLQEAAPREAYDHPANADAAAALGPVNVFDGRVEGGAVATPYGRVAAPGLSEGGAARVVVRIEAMTLTPGTTARVRDRRPHVAHDLVRLEAQGLVWLALVSPRAPTTETVDVALQPSGAFVFSG